MCPRWHLPVSLRDRYRWADGSAEMGAVGRGRLEEARSAAASAQSLLERGGGAEEQRRAAAELLGAVSEAREAWEARGRGVEALEAGGRGEEARLGC